MSRPVRKGRRHDYGACEKGGDCLRCEAEARRCNEEAERGDPGASKSDAFVRAARARGVRVVETPLAPSKAHQRRVALVAALAADLLAETPVPLEDDQAVKLALALVESGWTNPRKGRRS